MADRVTAAGGRVLLRRPVRSVRPDLNGWKVHTDDGGFDASRVLITTAPTLAAEMLDGTVPEPNLERLRAIDYLANTCLVLELDRSLTDAYWVNVNDPSFPFVGLIEHTNFERPESYAGRHIVYLSKYLRHTDPLYSLGAEAFLEFALPYLARMFPAFRRDWVLRAHIWKARWAQPVIVRHYAALIPPDMLATGLYLASMAQIYPEDRGTNHAVREGRRIACRIAAELGDAPS
jgi:protoporphyrinogen oxidase